MRSYHSSQTLASALVIAKHGCCLLQLIKLSKHNFPYCNYVAVMNEIKINLQLIHFHVRGLQLKTKCPKHQLTNEHILKDCLLSKHPQRVRDRETRTHIINDIILKYSQDGKLIVN